MPETWLNFYTEDKGIWFCSSKDKYIRLIKKLAKENPGQVDIIKEPEQNNGMIYCEIPKSWLRIRPPAKSLNELAVIQLLPHFDTLAPTTQ